METKEIKADIIISGAGHAGCALALLLGSAGFSVALINPETKPPMDEQKPTGRTVALLNSSINVLKAAGVWNAVQKTATPLKTMKIVDDSQGHAQQISVAFHAKEVQCDQFGFNIPNNILKNAMMDAVKANKNIRHLCPASLVNYAVSNSDVIATLDDGKVIAGKIIVGTDGRNSIVRQKADIDCKIHDYGQTAITCLIAHSKPHNNVATEIHRSGGPFTFVPMAENHSSIVWVEKTDDAKKFLKLKRQEFEQALQDRTCGFLGTITLESSPESWPLMYLDANTLIGERCAIAAESAHVLSPIGAQGLNLSMRDVASLAEILTDAARLGEDIGCSLVLARYQKRRSLDIKSHVTGIDTLNRAVANDRAFINDMRRMGLKSLSTIPSVKNFAMTQGLVPSMDEGRILMGQAL